MPISRPESKLAQNPYSTKKYYYPQDLGEVGSEPYMLFDIRDGVINKQNSLGIIGMYLPRELQVKYSTQYQEIDMGVVKDVARGAAVIGDAWNLNGKEVLRDILGGVGNALDTTTALNATALNERMNGRIVNNHMAKLFKGVDFRVFQFNFHLAARNKKESDMIKNIEKAFKYHAMPEFSSDSLKRFMLYPDNFIISVHSPATNYLFRIGACALVDFQVDYAGSGQQAFFRSTGAPVDVRFSMTFAELDLITKQKILEGY